MVTFSKMIPRSLGGGSVTLLPGIGLLRLGMLKHCQCWTLAILSFDAGVVSGLSGFGDPISVWKEASHFLERLDDRQIAHLICVRLNICYMTFWGVFWASLLLFFLYKRPKTPPKKVI